MILYAHLHHFNQYWAIGTQQKFWELTREILRRDIKNVWWMMMGWNPKEDETLLPIAKSRRRQITRWLMVRWWEYTFFYVYFLFCCLFASNGDYGLLFFQQYLLCCNVRGGCISSGVEWFALNLWWRKAKELKMKIRKELPSGQQWGFNKLSTKGR